MKTLIFSALAALIIMKSAQAIPFCNLAIVKLALPPRIFQETTIDGNRQNVILTRFFHNKVGIYGSEVGRCYFNAFDLNFIAANVTIPGLLSILFLLYKSISRKYWPFALFLIVPILPFFGLPPLIFTLIYKVFAIIGIAFLLNNR